MKGDTWGKLRSLLRRGHIWGKTVVIEQGILKLNWIFFSLANFTYGDYWTFFLSEIFISLIQDYFVNCKI